MFGVNLWLIRLQHQTTTPSVETYQEYPERFARPFNLQQNLNTQIIHHQRW